MADNNDCHFCGKSGHFARDCDIKARSTEAERNGGKVFVGNLRKDVEKQDLLDEFEKIGEVLTTWVARQPPGFGFVTYADSRDAKDAVADLHQKETSFSEPGGMRVEISHLRSDRGRRDRGGRSRDRGGFRDYDGRGSRGYFGGRGDRRRNSRSRSRSRGRGGGRGGGGGRRGRSNSR